MTNNTRDHDPKLDGAAKPASPYMGDMGAGEFAECTVCATKRGTPQLCNPCLHNRWAVAQVVAERDEYLKRAQENWEMLQVADKRAEADLATARGRLRDTCQILVACVGADGPTNAEDVARDIVAEVARLKAELAQRGEVRELRAAVKRLLAMSLNGSVRDEMAARARARKAPAAVDAELHELSIKETTK